MPAVQTVLAPIRDHVFGVEAAVLVGVGEQVADAAAVDAVDLLGDVHGVMDSTFGASMAVVRVVAGSARGRRLLTPVGGAVRPTSDRVREAVGNALGSMGALTGARVLDLFAGSGALGIEALSRGAASADLVEPDRVTRQVIEANLGLLVDTRARIVASTAATHLASCGEDSYDLVFADPPYSFDDWDGLFDLLGRVIAPEGVVVAESDRSIDPGPGWEIFREKRYGSTVVGINVRSAAAPLPGVEM